MILYNTLMGVAAGASMIAIASLARAFGRREEVSPAGWAAALLALGLVLAFLGGTMSVTWPLNAKPQTNILFGEPTLFLGALLLAASLLLWTRQSAFVGLKDESTYSSLLRLLTPLAWLAASLGVILAVCAVTVVRFAAFGDAPPQEPISGSLPGGVENTLLAACYGMAALGTLPSPWSLRNLSGILAKVQGWLLTVAGVLVLAYSAMNYYTHVGLLMAS